MEMLAKLLTLAVALFQSCAMNFLLEHPSLVDSEVFEELPEHLQTEIEEQMWRGSVASWWGQLVHLVGF